MCSPRIWLVALLLALPLGAPAAAFERPFNHREHSLEHRPEIIFPRKRGEVVHVSPFPMGKRAASIWLSDACFRDCNGRCAWRFAPCQGAIGDDQCRPELDRCARICQTECRTRGGPAIPGAAD